VERDGAVPEGEFDDDGGCCEEEEEEGAGSLLERCCHLILLLKRFFISAPLNPRFPRARAQLEIFIWLAKWRVT